MGLADDICAWGSACWGWIIPFLFVLTHRRVLPRARPFPGRALVRRQGAGVLDRLRSRAVRLQRPPRHALEALRHSARRLREILRRRECRERARPGGARRDEPRRSGGHSFIHQPVGPRAAIVAAGPIANFLLAIVIFAGSVHDLSASRARRRGSIRSSRTARPRRPASSPAIWSWRSTDARSRASPTCSGSSASAPARR